MFNRFSFTGVAMVGTWAVFAAACMAQSAATTSAPAASADSKADRIKLSYNCTVSGIISSVTAKKEGKTTDISRSQIASMKVGPDDEIQLQDGTKLKNLVAITVGSAGISAKFRPEEVTEVELRCQSLDTTAASAPTPEMTKLLEQNTKAYNAAADSLRDSYKKNLAALDKSFAEKDKPVKTDLATQTKKRDQLRQQVQAQLNAADRKDDSARRTGNYRKKDRLQAQSDRDEKQAKAKLKEYNELQDEIDKDNKKLQASAAAKSAAQSKLGAWSVSSGKALKQVSDKHVLVIRAGGHIDESQMKSNFDAESTPAPDESAKSGK